MNRRDFMKGILAVGMAPAIVKAENIMRINPDHLIVPKPVFAGVDISSGQSRGTIVLLNNAGKALARMDIGFDWTEMLGKSINLDPMIVSETGIINSIALENERGQTIGIDVKCLPSVVMPGDSVHLLQPRLMGFRDD